MDIFVLFTIGASLFLSSFLQSVAGFGFSLVALPLLFLLSDVGTIEAIVICTVASTLQKLIFMKSMRSHIDWRELRSLIGVGLMGVMLGIGLLYYFSSLDKSFFKQAIGLLILIILFVNWFFKIKPTDGFKKWWGIIAAFISGSLSGLANIGGPPIVIWILSHKWNQEKMRVVTVALTLCFAPFQLFMLYIIFGVSMALLSLKSVVYFPFVYIGTWLGTRIGNKINASTTRTFMFGLLIIICVILITEPFF